jgi:hypothetical protein
MWKMWKSYSSKIKFIFKFFASIILVFLTIELLEIYLWKNDYFHDKSNNYRDREYSLKKPNNIFRILVLGDSQTYGQGIKNFRDTWHEKLESLMNQGFKAPKFEIISLAGKGWNTDTQLYELFGNGFRLNPDLILIGFNLNDIPAPHHFDCSHEDFALLPQSKFINWLRNSSLVYQLFEFRINRVIEILEKKPEYTECINRRYESRGWSMETVYLDTIVMSSQIKNVHLMMTTLPLLYKLGDDYPLKKPHAKIKSYCQKREIECLDLYDEGFKGLSAAPLLVSITDRHFNEKGTEIAAQSLFKRLQSLKKYNNLNSFSGAFSLKEILDQKPIITELDNRLSKIKDKEGTLQINFEGEILEVTKRKKTLQFSHTTKNQTKLKNKKITFDSNRNFINSSISFVKDNSKTYVREKSRKNKNFIINNYFLDNDLKIIDKQETLYYLNLKKNMQLELTKNYLFWDPKVFEQNIFSKGIERGPKTEKLILRGLDFYKNFTFRNLNHKNYFNQITGEVLEKKPSIAAIRAVKKIQSQ